MNRNALKTVFLDTLPVMTGYIFLGIGFGILLSEQAGKGLLWSAAMAVFMFAGSAQYLTVLAMWLVTVVCCAIWLRGCAVALLAETAAYAAAMAWACRTLGGVSGDLAGFALTVSECVALAALANR